MNQLIKRTLIRLIKELSAAAFLLDRAEARVHMDHLSDFDAAVWKDQDDPWFGENLYVFKLELYDNLQNNMFRYAVRGLGDTDATDYVRRNMVLTAFDEFVDALRMNNPSIWTAARERFVKSLGEEAQP